MSADHHGYAVRVTWTGNKGTGTSGYRAYARHHVISAEGKPDIAGSADPAFLGDPARWNPEDLLLASVSACHKLWYLHLCAVNKIIIERYEDEAEGVMVTGKDGSGRFTEITLKPKVWISSGDADLALKLHHEAHEKCFIANSVNFPIGCQAEIVNG